MLMSCRAAGCPGLHSWAMTQTQSVSEVRQVGQPSMAFLMIVPQKGSSAEWSSFDAWKCKTSGISAGFFAGAGAPASA